MEKDKCEMKKKSLITQLYNIRVIHIILVGLLFYIKI